MKFDNWVWEYEGSSLVRDIQAKFVEELSDTEKFKIAEFRSRVKDVLQDKHDDFFLRKWLVAKKWNMEVAENMLRKHFQWRQEWEVDRIREYNPSEVLKEYLPLGLIGEDKNGLPLFVLPVRALDVVGLISSNDNKSIYKYLIYVFEYGDKLRIIHTEKYGRTITCFASIVDLDGVRYKDILWKPVYELLLQLLRLIEDHNPGIIGKLFIINASKVFYVLYSMLKAFLRDDTKNRIFIFGKDSWKEELLKHVDPGQLPVHWGGTLVDETDGNPYCSSKLGMRGKVPKSLYLVSQRKNSFQNNTIETITVARREIIAVDVEMPFAGSTLSYSIWIKQQDIGFGVNRQSSVLVPVKRINSETGPVKADIYCQESGTYSFVFDNSFSWYRSKKVSYIFQIVPAEPHLNR